ncbi:MAG: hypothetical protein EXR39_09015 [Betaproteobacteria bacterium]|nr:hypothetical protein [Betaproteobacteria bacterium]
MKKTDLEKNKAKQIVSSMRGGATPDRYGQGAATAFDKREQRKRDQALGLVPFACKLDSELIAQLHAAATEQALPMNELVAALLRKGLANN